MKDKSNSMDVTHKVYVDRIKTSLNCILSIYYDRFNGGRHHIIGKVILVEYDYFLIKIGGSLTIAINYDKIVSSYAVGDHHLKMAYKYLVDE